MTVVSSTSANKSTYLLFRQTSIIDFIYSIHAILLGLEVESQKALLPCVFLIHTAKKQWRAYYYFLE